MVSKEKDGNGEIRALPRLEDILKELELLRRVHVKALISRDGSGLEQGSPRLDEKAIKQVTSYVRLVEKIIRIIERRDRLLCMSPLEDAPLSVVLQVLKDVPEVKEVIERKDVLDQIISRIKDRLEEIKGGGGRDSGADQSQVQLQR